MIEKIGHIRNPLTIIAMFAAIAEISGVSILPFIDKSNQSVYTYFLVAFPLFLVSVFFLTLNFNHRVLYAPSDYKDEGNFIKSLKFATSEERAEKLKEAVREADEGMADKKPPKDASGEQGRVDISKAIRQSVQGRYLVAEELILAKLSKEAGQEVRRDVKTHGSPHVFDGLFAKGDKTYGVEVKYLRNVGQVKPMMMMSIDRISRTVLSLPDTVKNGFNLILCVATDEPTEEMEKIAARVRDVVKNAPFPVDVRVYNLEKLESEFALN